MYYRPTKDEMREAADAGWGPTFALARQILLADLPWIVAGILLAVVVVAVTR